MQVNCYSTEDEVKIWYYNGETWSEEFYDSVCDYDGGTGTYTDTITITSGSTTQYIRGQVTWETLSGDDQCYTGEWGDNDDLAFSVDETCTSSQTRQCTVDNGVGTQTRQCVGGYYADWSACTVTSCDTGYSLCGNACYPDTQSCTITGAVASQTGYCSGSTWHWNTCTVEYCKTGYYQEGNTCVFDGTAELYAGTAKVDITCECPHLMGGYVGLKQCTGIHDNLYARILVLDDGETSIALVSLDHEFYCSDKVIEQAKQLYGIDHVILTSSHVHSGPAVEGGGIEDIYATGGFSLWSRSLEYTVDWDALSSYDSWYAESEDNIISAIGEAVNNMFPASLSVGRGTLDSDYMSFNRRIVSSNGCVSMCWTYCPPTEPADQTVGVIRVHDDSGNTRAMMVNYACHPVSLAEQNYQISADFPGTMAAYIEEEIPGAVGMFMQGAAGDIDPYYMGSGSSAFNNIKNAGEDLAKEALSVNTQPLSSGLIEVKESLLQFENRKDSAYGYTSYYNDGPHYGGLTTVVIGDSLAVAAVAGEWFIGHQINLRENSPLPNTFLFGYSYNGQGDHFPVYVPTEEAATQCNYCTGGTCDNYGGDYVTYWEIGAGEAIIDEALDSIAELLAS